VSGATARDRRPTLALCLCLCLGLCLALGGGVGAAAPPPPPAGDTFTGPPPTTLLEVSNFRFCRNAPCDADQQGYVRGPSGPVADNPAASIRVLPGARVTWTYADSTCDSLVTPPLDCPGHQVVLENGTAAGTTPIGSLPARSGPVTFEWYVPWNARPGSLLRYFCRVANHAQMGLTGVLEVVSPARG
jgi:hypothetical protein